MPKGIETPIGKISEGSIDLSGGQWQRVAIVRTLVSNAPIHILDEPNAALDPISESNIYKLVGKVSKGKSTILITHRLGAARTADEILVVDGGVIAEQGTHEELINKNGIYKEMFDAQRSWY
ncbi:ATP-binding cassette domain-containing protein [Abyssisolibacter fermentans]|uniref:ATP-binding cassette domain-containing protein n=1 Tax=Abyssisolibacter fermentans TaxID=1766203 RepID=UPI00082E1C8A|nr:ATP-binding cassette domain-containing protein [Abyssisolibacter fermentans]